MRKKAPTPKQEQIPVPVTYDNLLAQLKTKTGLDIYGHSSQDGMHFQYGFAYILFPKPFYGKIQFRKESGEGWEGKYDQEIDLNPSTPDWIDRLIEIASETLSTGRTLECGKGVGIRKLQEQVCPQTVQVPLNYLLEDINGKGSNPPWDLNPDYQRGHVWTKEQSQKFIGHFLTGGHVLPIVVQRYDSEENAPKEHKHDFYNLPNEVIDGQQRLKAIVQWLKGEIYAELPLGGEIWYRDLNEIDQRAMPYLPVGFVDLPRVERLRYYLRLNAGGTVHTNEEIEKVRQLLSQEGSK